MLKKLFKYEMRATARTFVWLYIAFAAIVVVNVLLGQNMAAALNAAPSVLQSVMLFLYMLAVVTIMIVTLVVVILRFYRNLLGDEGYLMMTLPVSREQHMLSKLFAATVWCISSSLLVILSIVLLTATMGGFPAALESVGALAEMGLPVGRYVILIIINLLVGCASGILTLYASMAVGPNLLKNRVAGSILAFIIISVICNIFAFVAMAGVGSGLVGPGVLFTDTDISRFIEANMARVIDSLLGACIICNAAVAAGCWFLTRHMLKRRLNLP
jgi:hypothetical protein